MWCIRQRHLIDANQRARRIRVKWVSIFANRCRGLASLDVYMKKTCFNQERRALLAMDDYNNRGAYVIRRNYKKVCLKSFFFWPNTIIIDWTGATSIVITEKENWLLEMAGYNHFVIDICHLRRRQSLEIWNWFLKRHSRDFNHLVEEKKLSKSSRIRREREPSATTSLVCHKSVAIVCPFTCVARHSIIFSFFSEETK